MSNGPFEKWKQKRVWLPLVLAAAAILVAVICFAPRAEEVPGQTQGSVQSDPQQTRPEETAGTIPQETENGTEPAPSDPAVDPETTDPAQPVETVPEPSAPGTGEPVQRADAEYEKWLGAALVVCVSMEHPDFELEGVYAASATALEEKFSSDGAWILFSSGGSRMAIHAVPLKEERTESGTSDISTEAIGFATFDRVDPGAVDLASMEQLPVEELGELIEQSLLVSIYTR